MNEDEKEKRGLLKDEYLHLQQIIREFDNRAVTIKAWSITFSMTTVVGAFVYHISVAFWLSCVSSLMFWLIETYWKTFQYAYYDRTGKIEDYFSGDLKTIVPMQIGKSWYKRYQTGGAKRFMKIMFRPHVSLPHNIVFVSGIVLYILYKISFIRI